MKEFLEYASNGGNQFFLVVVVIVVCSGLVGLAKYAAYSIRGKPEILDEDEDE